MLKKIIPIILVLCLMFSISAMAENTTDSNVPAGPSQEMPVQGGERMQDRSRSGQMPRGEFTPPQNNMMNTDESAAPQENNVPRNENAQDINSNPENNAQNSNQAFGQDGQPPVNMQGGFPNQMQNSIQAAEAEQTTGFISFVKTYSTPITAIILLVLAFVFVIFYKRKNY